MSILLLVSVDVGNNTLQEKNLVTEKKRKIIRNSLLTSPSGLKVAATER